MSDLPNDPDLPRYKDGSIIPPDQFDNEPTLIGEDDLNKAYPNLDKDDEDLIKELDTDE